MTTSVADIEWPKPITISAGRDCLERYQRWSAEAFITADIESLLTDRSAFIDNLLRQLWQQLGLDETELALIAVGGYGRGTLHPHSDIDLLFLHSSALCNKAQQAITSLVQMLWDLRLDVGHSVRTLNDCQREATADTSVATSLLEQRFISGNADLEQALRQLIHTDFPWTSDQFYHAKLDEQNERHQQFHGTSYNLEPNIKSSPGGLRDIQTIGWIAKRHFHTQSDESLVQYNYISAAELLELRECQEFLWRIRFALHLEAGKKEDRLLFDHQPAVAARMGYEGRGKAAVEAMMKDYFNAVVDVSELNDMLLQFFAQTILSSAKDLTSFTIDRNFKVLGESIAAQSDDVFAEPEHLLELFLAIAEHPEIRYIRAHTIRLLRNARRELNHPLSDVAACRELFMRLLRHPRGCGLAFELMHRHKIMAHYLPQWAQIVGQMQFDLFHAYTVDEHTFRLVRNLYRYTTANGEEEFPLCASIVADMDKPELLYLAGVFHDIAKGRGGDHSELGELDARNFGLQHGLDEQDTDLVAWLVRQHLYMSVTAQKRDIHDPEVIEEFARQVDTPQRLDYLYCLTVADIRATNNSLWNNWKATLLENLYQATRNYLLQQKPSPQREMRQRIHEHQAHAMALLLSAGFPVQQVQELWSRFTADYFLRHQPEQIAWHSQYIMAVSDDELLPLILVGDENRQGTTELFIYHLEHEHLFAEVAAVLDHQNLSIHDAQILATRDGFVMDTFVVLQDDGEPLTNPRHIERLKQELHDVLRARRPAPSTQRRLPRRLRSFKVPTKVEFVPSRNARRTAFELTALDRPGLVAQVARVLQQLDLNILTAKISTVGEQAEDLFIVATEANTALAPEQCDALREQIMLTLDDN
ncbi:[protein-PII] uridylyltransferase [Pseudidiomarina sp. 1APP75-32.1]|uniref:Bifunctional uridylyltransferase/uridylyl-removing enzyme n=1 Tax=Pseudidiomarina terrestris TaxID=2820060 RepID=A0AAW7QWV6_9GAMM|nr:MULTISPECIES: [protein-PII] uridylyltransferase [unclassified Pseudidiomarina]MDN7123549.1 [protein-PII] uridylyltransferase [Pseudidiomarina sp. 1APP75-32.1]MDN7128727.1 [protein-PII] uridylyltransferase [Pseudidiomarina sp. 1APR75-15]MEA3587207.1 [protein-PII] uridylyltransferase [Pseudidiomarina sp. 1APP75-27a]